MDYDGSLLAKGYVTVSSLDNQYSNKEKCDQLASIKMPGGIESLNASVTAGILLFDYVRQNNNPNS